MSYFGKNNNKASPSFCKLIDLWCTSLLPCSGMTAKCSQSGECVRIGVRCTSSQ